MIELRSQNTLVFSFPEVHPKAELAVSFARTLRIPDDDKAYPLPPGLGRFPLRHLDDQARSVPESWLARGGVMLPMYQSEAMWLSFSSANILGHGPYPFALKVAAGKINAVSGGGWSEPLRTAPQDYMVVPTQPWLDGFAVGDGLIRQFVATPLGSGYSAEEQLTGRAEVGGLQLIAYPMKRSVFERRFPYREPVIERQFRCCSLTSDAMGLAPGGKMRQQIFADPYGLDDWESDYSRCFVHIVNSRAWLDYTGQVPPHPPVSAQDYEAYGMPWFDYYRDDLAQLQGSQQLAGLKSLAKMVAGEGEVLPNNQTIEPKNVAKVLRSMIREGEF